MAASTASESGASSMAELMAKHTTPLVALKKGDIVKGEITRLTRSEIRVDVNAKSEAIVLEKDRQIMNSLLSALKLGDIVEVQILNPESDTGNPVVSLRRFMSDKSWDELATLQKDKQTIDVTVTESTKGGYVVVTKFGMNGFLPNSHTSFQQNQQVMVGSTISVSILELNRKENKIIVSQKSSVSDEEFAEIKKRLKKGEKITVTVVNITPFGIFVAVPVSKDTDQKIDGLIHISEIAWEKVDEIGTMVTPGQAIEVVVIGFDDDAKRIDLSIKQLTEDPFSLVAKKYPVDTRVSGAVSRVGSTGVAIDINGVEGMIRKEKLPPTVIYKVGDTINAIVSEVDTRHRRLLLVPVLLDKPIGYR